MLAWECVSKRYWGQSSLALCEFSLEVHDGEVVGLVGLNGAGKTTAIRMACGVTLPSDGTIRVDGSDILRQKVRASEHIGWVPESPNCDPDRRALKLLRYFAGFYESSGVSAGTRCREILKSVGLAGVEDERLRNFSQGMLKRFSLASAMVADPPNLLLDEILNGLDPEGVVFVRQWMKDLKGQDRAMLLSSHQLTEVQRIADRIAFLHRGRLLRVIPRTELDGRRAEGTRIRLRISNLDATALRYLESLGEVRQEGDALSLLARDIDPAALNHQLMERGYSVAEVSVLDTQLEEYFLSLIQAAA
jgi:ABC-2 type transport system ATP-binding protein